jgi:hypothetical protein
MLGIAGATGAAAQEAQIDGFAAKLAGLAKATREVSNSKAAQAQCAKSYSADSILQKRLSSGPNERPFTVLAVNRQACEAFRAGRPDLCTVFDYQGGASKMNSAAPGRNSTPIPNGFAKDCRNLYVDMVRTQVMMTSAKSPAAAESQCLQIVGRKELEVVPPGVDGRAFCDIAVHKCADAHACATAFVGLMPGGKGGELIAKVEKSIHLRVGTASSEECDKLEFHNTNGFPSRDECLAARAYRGAYRRGDPVLCRDSGICRALMGEPDGCDTYAQKMRADFCKSADFLADLALKRRSVALEVTQLQGAMVTYAQSDPRLSIAQKSRISSLEKESVELLRQLLPPMSYTRERKKR